MKTPTEIVDEIVDYALFGAASDEDPSQQEWAATLLDAVSIIMQKCGYEGKMTLTRDQINMNAEGCRKFARELRERETERLKNIKPIVQLPNPFETGKVNLDESGFPMI